MQTVRTQSPLRRITNTSEEGININPSISGDGRVVGFESTEDIAAAKGLESFRAIRANVSVDPPTFLQMGVTRAPAPAISQDGSRIAFASKDNPLGANDDGNSEIFLYDGAKLVQVTNTSPGDPALRVVNGNFLPSISDDGRFIAFSSNRDLANQNSDGNLEIFIFDTVALGFTQLTNSSGVGATDAKMSGNGTSVAYIRDLGAPPSSIVSAQRDLILQNRVGPPAIRVLATAVQSLAMTYGRAISDDGQRVVWSGETAINTTQVFLFDGRNNNTTRQITGLGSRATDVPLHPTISGNGSHIAFATRRSVSGAGSNSDTSVELYTFDIPSGTVGRVTNVNSSSANAAVLSSMNDDGAVIAFNYPRILSGAVSNEDFAGNSEIYVTGTPVTPAFGTLSILNRASMGHEPSSIKAVAPDSIAVALGSALSFSTEQAQRQADGTFPLTVGGTTVTVNGRRAQIFFVSPTEVHFHVPAATEIGNAEVVVTNSDGFQSRGTVPTLRAAPGVFTKSGDGLGEGMILNADTLTSGPFDPSSERLRLIIFSTGVRNSLAVSVSAGGRSLTLESIVTATNMPGMDEIHVLVPADLRGAGKVDLVVRADGRDSNPASVEFIGDARRDILINEFLADPPDGAAGDANHDGARDTSQDEFVELVNTTTHDIDIGGYQILTRGGSGSSDTLRHTFPTGSIVPVCTAIVVFGGGNSNFDPNHAAFGGAQVVKASSGSLTLFNSAGVITLRDSGGNIANFVAYGGSTGLDSDDNQSLTRAPDITGSFAKHGVASGGARLFSPGTQLDGSPFNSCTPTIARVEIVPSSATIEIGQQQQFTARAFDSSNNEVSGVLFLWRSSNTEVATIDQNGLATGTSAGSTGIRATGRGVQSAPASLIVNQPPPVLTSITISPASATLGVGGTQQFTAQAKDQFGQDIGGVTITFASNNTTVATVDSVSATSATGSATSTVTARGSGVTEIRASATNGTTTVTSAPATVVVEPGTGQLVISEFRTRGPSGAADEFVEIYNPTTSNLSIGGLRIRASNGSGTISDRVTITAGTTLGPGCHYLVANSSSSGYSGPVPADQTYGTGLTDDGGIAITGSNGTTIIDAVGMSNGSAYKEGPTLAPLGNNVNQSYERKPGGASGNGFDKNNNVADFRLNTDSSNPQNLASGCLDLSTADLSITKTDSPDPVFIGSDVTYVIMITNNGAGSAQSVLVTDDLPSGVSFVSCVATGGGVCAGTGNNRTVTFASLAGGASETITLVATASGPAGAISNTVSVSSTTLDPVASNNSASAITVVQAPPPGLAITDITANEGNAGTTTFTFNVSLSSPAPANVTFDIGTQNNTATVAVNDYVARALMSQTIPAGQQTYAFDVTVNGDLNVEPTETFFVNVTNVSGAVVTDGQGLGTIVNDDAASLVISQLYAGGGNAGAQFTNDFVEIFNRGNTTVNFADTPYSVQYAGATANFGSNKFDLTSGVIVPGQYFLVQLAGGAIGSPLPAPDASGSIVMAATAGKVALVVGTTALPVSTCPGDDGTAPFNPNNLTIVDFVGYGTSANCFEGAAGPTPAPGNTTADLRTAGGCTDTDDNAADFFVSAPAPRNTSSPLNDCNAEPPPSLTIDDATVTEGNATSTASFTVTLSAPAPAGGTTFNIATQDDTATVADNDYVARALTAQTIPAGQTTYTFDVTVNGDLNVESTETFFVNVTNVSGAIVIDGQGLGTIENDDAPRLVISQLYAGGGNSAAPLANDFVEIFNRGNTIVNFAVTPYSIQYAGATANFGSNKLALTSGTIAPGQYFLVQLSGGANGAALPTPDASGSIAMAATAGKVALVAGTAALPVSTCPGDDATPPFNPENLTIVDFVGYGTSANCFEGPVGPAPAPSNTTADFRTAAGCTDTDDNAADFLSSAPAPRNTSSPLNDCNAKPLPNLTVDDVAIAEGNNGTTTASFTVHLSASAPAGGVTFDIATQDDTATVADNDYVARAVMAQTIPAGQQTYAFDVTVNGDSNIEPNETFLVNVTNVSGANAIDSLGVASIQNDDTRTLSISDIEVIEGNSGNHPATFIVTSSLPAPAGGITFDIATQNGTAISSGDYLAKSLGNQTIPAGQTTYPFDVRVKGDLNVEPDESFLVNITNVSNATVMDGQGLGTIRNDDVANLAISQLYAGGGNSGAPFTHDFVELFNRGVTTVDFGVTPYSIQYVGATANFGSNKLNLTSGVILPGQYFLVQLSGGVNGAPLPTPNATGSITMAATAGKVALVVGTVALSGTGCPLAPTVADFIGYGAAASCFEGATGPAPTPSNTNSDFRQAGGCTDTNNNAADFFVHPPGPRNTGSPLNNCVPGTPPNLSIADVAMSEGNSGNKVFTFTVNLSSPAPSVDITFDIATADGTAQDNNPAAPEDNDYVAKTLTNQIIPAGQQTYRFDVTVHGDLGVEPNETFFVNVTNVAGATVTDGQGLGTIQNDDLPLLSIDDVSLSEGNGGTKLFTFIVSLSAAAPETVSLDIATQDGTATIANNDYVARSLTGQTIPAGSQNYTFDVTVNGDLSIEPNETFFVNVTSVSGAAVADGQGVGTIQNDDTPALIVDDVIALEGDSGTTTFSFTVSSTLPAPPGGITFDIATADNTATAGSGDYVSRTLTSQTIPAGQQSYMFDVTVNGDTVVELNETFFVNITNVSGASVADGTGQGTIQNDDTPLLVISQLYGAGGNVGAPFSHDFIEVFNRGTTTVDLTGWSVQYNSTSGTDAWSVTPLCPSGPCLLVPGQYFLVQEAGSGVSNLPTPDVTGTTSMATASGKLALVNSTTALSGGCPAASPSVIDRVGYGSTPATPDFCFEGAGPAPAPRATRADFRESGGCTDTNDNGADFVTGSPGPRSTASPLNDCNAPPLLTTVTISPVSATIAVGDTQQFTGQALDQFGQPIGGVTVTFASNNTAVATVDSTTPTSGTGSATATATGQASGTAEITAMATDGLINVTSSPATLSVEPAAGQVLISEFRTRGPVSASDEFIEIYNPTSAAVVIGGLKIRASTSTGTPSDRVTITSGTILGPGCHYLVANNTPTTGYSGPTSPDQTYTTAIADTGGIAITRSDNGVIDAVGMSAGSAYQEGAMLTALAGSADQSYERKPGGASGNGVDTNNNATDFFLNPSSSNPQNSSSGCLNTISADLAITNTDSPDPVDAGENITYTLTLTNNSSIVSAQNVTLSDQVPTNTTFVSVGTLPSGWTRTDSTVVGGSGTITFNRASMPATSPDNSAIFTITVKVDLNASDNSSISNTATVTSDTPDAMPGNNSDNEITTVRRPADLSLTKTVNDATPDVNDDVTFTITLNNDGPSAATGVEITDSLPSGLAFVSSTPSQGSYDNSSGVWTVGTVSVSSPAATLAIVATVQTTGAKVNTAEVTASDLFDPDSTPDNQNAGEDDQSSVTVTPVVVQQSDLSLTKTVNNQTPNIGEKVTFTITLNNAGPDPANGVQVKDLLPAGLLYVSSTVTQGTYASGTGIWDVGTASVGSPAATLTIIATVQTVGGKANTAEVTASTTSDPDSAPNDETGDDFASLIVTAAANLVINEVHTQAQASPPADANDFVELYNKSVQPIDVSGLVISTRSTNSTTTANTFILPASTVIQPNSYLIIVNGATTYGVTADFNASASTFNLTATSGGVKIELNGVKLDGLAYQSSAANTVSATFAAFGEGTVFISPVASGQQDYVRSPNGADSNDNATDFRRSGANSTTVTPKTSNPTVP